ncbi:MAG TPA: O-antigen ligase family protein [Terriglobales bacterium]|nr:O-antigen ligase family protein [Terriglobales bacterium]
MLQRYLAPWLFISTLAISTLTSIAPPVTAFKVYQIAVSFLFSILFLDRHGMEQFFKRLLIGNLLLTSCIGVFALAAPELVYEFSETNALRLRGTAITEAGPVAGFSLVLLLCTNLRIPRWRFVTLLLLSSWMLMASLTRVAWIAVAFVVCLALVLRPRVRHIRWIRLIGVSAALALSLGALQELQNYRKPEDIYTLSNRVGLWQYMTDAVVQEAPLTGFGYLAGPRSIGLEYNPMLGSGHSILMDVYVSGGLLSLAMFFIMMFRSSQHSFRLLRRHCDSITFTSLSLFAAVLIMGFVGGDLDNSPFGFTFWGLTAALPLLAATESSYAVRRAEVLATVESVPES